MNGRPDVAAVSGAAPGYNRRMDLVRQLSAPGPFARRVIAAIAGLTLLFAVLAPAASEPLGFGGRLLFWLLHISLGLGAALLAARAMVASFAVPRDWRLILFSGAAGVLLFSPAAWFLETLFPVVEEWPDGDLSDDWGKAGMVAAMLVEAVELAPSYLAAWFLVNLEPLMVPFRAVRAADPEPHEPHPPHDGREAFLARLPAAIGTELTAVSSDLHYLQVYTLRGHAMILGSLQEVEEAFGDDGLRVHRSHWVVAERVVQLRQKGNQLYAEVEGSHRVPVSRRRRGEITARLGRDFRRKAGDGEDAAAAS